MDNLENLQPEQPITGEPVVNIEPEKPRKIRRVGTFTMGIALIVTGLVLCATLILPFSNVILIAKLSPLLLVAIGVEVIIATFKNDGTKIKYDFLSFFICLFLMFGALAASLLPTLYEYFGPERNAAQSRIENDIATKLLDKLDKYPSVFRITSNVNLSGLRTFTGDETVNNLQNGDWVSIYVELSGDYTTKEEFAADVLPIFEEACALVPSYLQLSAKSLSDSQRPYYEINLGSGVYTKLSAKILAQNVIEYTYSEEYGNYFSAEEYDNVTSATQEYVDRINELESLTNELNSLADSNKEDLQSRINELEQQLSEMQSENERLTNELSNASSNS